MKRWIGERITNLVDAILVALVPVILIGAATVIAFVGTEHITIPIWLVVVVLALFVGTGGFGFRLWWRMRSTGRTKALEVRRAIVALTEELEHSEHVLKGSDAPQFFVNHELAHGRWETLGPVLADAGLIELHKTIRSAYRSIDALNNRGVRRGVTYSNGRKTTMLDGTRLNEARAEIRSALEALDEAQT